MGHLVYCPTCNGKMSNNARCCPHCGETRFFEKSKSFEDIKCNCCQGRGVYSYFENSLPIAYVNGRIYYPTYFKADHEEYDFEIADTKIVGERVEVESSSDARKAIARGDFRIRNLTSSDLGSREIDSLSEFLPYKINAMIEYNKVTKTCVECEGKGKIKVESANRIDLRRKV